MPPPFSYDSRHIAHTRRRFRPEFFAAAATTYVWFSSPVTTPPLHPDVWRRYRCRGAARAYEVRCAQTPKRQARTYLRHTSRSRHSTHARRAALSVGVADEAQRPCRALFSVSSFAAMAHVIRRIYAAYSGCVMFDAERRAMLCAVIARINMASPPEYVRERGRTAFLSGGGDAQEARELLFHRSYSARPRRDFRLTTCATAHRRDSPYGRQRQTPLFTRARAMMPHYGLDGNAFSPAAFEMGRTLAIVR